MGGLVLYGGQRGVYFLSRGSFLLLVVVVDLRMLEQKSDGDIDILVAEIF